MSDTGDMLRILGRHVGSYDTWDELDETSLIFYNVRLKSEFIRLPVFTGLDKHPGLINLIFDSLTGRVEVQVLNNVDVWVSVFEFDVIEWINAAELGASA